MTDLQRRNVRIKSAHLFKSVFLRGSYVEMGKSGDQHIQFNFTIPVHNDLRNAFHKLNPHAVKLAEIYDAKGMVDDNRINTLGFTISGEDDAEGVVISLIRTLSNEKEVLMNTPFQRWDDQNTPYIDGSDLSDVLEECKAEVYAYLFEGKLQPTNQLSLFDSLEV